MDKTSITHMNPAHSVWLSSLDFYKAELNTLKARLTEVAGKNTSRDIAPQVEQYENQLKVQAENIDALAHDIRSNGGMAAEEAARNGAGYIDKEIVVRQVELEQKVRSEEKAVNDLRHSLNRFAAEWL
jgi:hypothetical protein